MERRKAEYENLVSRAKAYNAGLTLPPQPKREFYTKVPIQVFVPPAPPPPSKFCYDEEPDDDFDPAADAAED